MKPEKYIFIHADSAFGLVSLVTSVHNDGIAGGEQVRGNQELHHNYFASMFQCFIVDHSQWCGFKEPDPRNIQFPVLKDALRAMLAGKVVVPTPMMQGVPGIPTSTKFDKQLKGCLCWIDFYGVPQVSTSANSAPQNTTEDQKEDESSSSSSDAKSAHAKMMSAISSLPAYVERSSMFFVLVPVVPHNEIVNHNCEYITWQRRGWCRYAFRIIIFKI